MPNPAWVPHEDNPRPFRVFTLRTQSGLYAKVGYFDADLALEITDEMLDVAERTARKDIVPRGPEVVDLLHIWHGDACLRAYGKRSAHV